MNRRNLTVLYLIAALLFLRFVGAHAHIHNHVAVAGQGMPVVMQFAGGDEHGNSHVQDVDVDILDASFSKKPGFYFEQSPLIALVLLFLLSWLSIAYVRRFVGHGTPLPVFNHLLPPSRAPPA